MVRLPGDSDGSSHPVANRGHPGSGPNRLHADRRSAGPPDRPGGERTIQSAADGAFAFDDLSPGVYVVTALLAGLPCGSTSTEMESGETVTTSIDCASTVPDVATLAITGVVLMVLGAVWIRKITQIEV